MSRGLSSAAPRCSGMTLLELLIAMAVFALLSVMAYTGLRAVLDADQATAQQAKRLAYLQRAVTLLSGDLEQMANRSIRDAYGDRLPALDARLPTRLEWTRAGWRNPAGHLRSTLQRVAYEVEDDELVRSVWNVLDRAQDSLPEKGTLLEGVTSMSYRMLDRDRVWRDSWPPEPDKELEPPLPLAVELSLVTERWGTIRRLVVLPAGGA